MEWIESHNLTGRDEIDKIEYGTTILPASPSLTHTRQDMSAYAYTQYEIHKQIN